MKLTAHFGDFLSDVVNLNNTRVSLLEDSVIAIQNFIRGSKWTPEIIELDSLPSPQHSLMVCKKCIYC